MLKGFKLDVDWDQVSCTVCCESIGVKGKIKHLLRSDISLSIYRLCMLAESVWMPPSTTESEKIFIFQIFFSFLYIFGAIKLKFRSKLGRRCEVFVDFNNQYLHFHFIYLFPMPERPITLGVAKDEDEEEKHRWKSSKKRRQNRATDERWILINEFFSSPSTCFDIDLSRSDIVALYVYFLLELDPDFQSNVCFPFFQFLFIYQRNLWSRTSFYQWTHKRNFVWSALDADSKTCFNDEKFDAIFHLILLALSWHNLILHAETERSQLCPYNTRLNLSNFSFLQSDDRTLCDNMQAIVSNCRLWRSRVWCFWVKNILPSQRKDCTV